MAKWIRARMWKYPNDLACQAPDGLFTRPQRLIISANPEDHELPWGVILEDRVTMYDFAKLHFSGQAVAKCDWDADNYWFPKMWIEVFGSLGISGTTGMIFEAGDEVKRG